MARMGTLRNAAVVMAAIRSHGGKVTLVDKLRATPAMVADVVTGRWSGVARWRIVASLLGIVYVLSPLDLMPELLLGPFGIGDDLALAALSVASLFNATEQWLDDRVGGEVIEGEVLNRQ